MIEKRPPSLRMGLIGIVVLQAQIVGAFGHVWAFERPAIPGAAIIAENVFVIERSPINHDVAGVFPDQINLVGRESISGHAEVGFLSGKQSKRIYEKSWGWRAEHRMEWR
jgi:hypothetical protein